MYVILGVLLLALFQGADQTESVSKLLGAAQRAAAEGAHAKSASLLRQALDEAIASFGPEDARLAGIYNDLGVALGNSQDNTGAEAALEGAIAIYQKAKPDDPLLAQSWRNLADTRFRMKKPPAALAAARQALVLDEARVGKKHAELVESLLYVGNLSKAAGEVAGAEQAYRRVHEIRVAVSGPDALPVAQALDNLALFYEELHRDAEGTPLFEEALRIRRLKLPELHTEILNSLYRLGDNLRLAGKLERAETTLAEADRLGVRVFGPDSPAYIAVLEKRVLALKALEADAKAKELTTRIARLQEVARWQQTLAKAVQLRGAGKLPEAEQALQKVLEQAKGPQCVAMTHQELGELAFAQKNFPQSLIHMQQALSLNQEVFGQSHPTVAGSWLNLAAIQAQLGDKPQAEAAIQKCVESNRTSGRPDKEVQLNAEAIWAGLCEAQGKFGDAAQHFEQVVVLRKELNKPRDLSAGNAWFALGTCCLKAGRLPDARTSFEEARGIFSRLLPAEHQIFKTLETNLAEINLAIASRTPDPAIVAPSIVAPPPTLDRIADPRRPATSSAQSAEPAVGPFMQFGMLLVVASYVALVARRRGYSGLTWFATCVISTNAIMLFSLLAVLPNRAREKQRAKEHAALAALLAQISGQRAGGRSATAASDRSLGDEQTVL